MALNHMANTAALQRANDNSGLRNSSQRVTNSSTNSSLRVIYDMEEFENMTAEVNYILVSVHLIQIIVILTLKS